MRPLFELAIIVTLPFMFFGEDKTTAVYKPSKAQYCNSRFEFCVSYPATLLPHQKVSDNDDGVVLRTSDQIGEVSVTGSYNVLQWSPKELFDFTIEQDMEGQKGFTLISSDFNNKDYESRFKLKGKEFYHKAYFHKDFYILEIISVPASEPELLTKLQEEVSVNFHM
ncbi:MAG: hypothetical protein AAB316_03425 [Bacteroidota bacterium]